MRTATVEQPKDGIVFYSERDKGSDTPAWYFDSHREQLEDEIHSDKMRLKSGHVRDEAAIHLQEKIKKNEESLSLIDRERPNLKGNEKDRVYHAWKELGQKVAEQMDSRTNQHKWGNARDKIEAQRMTQGCIELDGDAAELASRCNIRFDSKGRVSRDEAAKAWQIMGKALGEDTFVEMLRKD